MLVSIIVVFTVLVLCLWCCARGLVVHVDSGGMKDCLTCRIHPYMNYCTVLNFKKTQDFHYVLVSSYVWPQVHFPICFQVVVSCKL